MAELPRTYKSVRLVERRARSVAEGTSSGEGQWHEIEIHEGGFSEQPKRSEGEEELLTVRVKGFAYNHRDVWIRRGLYRGIQFGGTMGSDCMGEVVLPQEHALAGKEVLVYPAVNWLEDERGGPDVAGKAFGILGGTVETQGTGTFAEYLHVPASHCVVCPPHLDAASAPAVPLAGLTAFRAVFTKAQVRPSHNVLITGIGGGVAIWALQFCLAHGANVWVSSSSHHKIQLACQLGAKGGVDYTKDDWPKQLASLLPPESPFLDAVIDSGGGDIPQKTCRLLRPGGIIVNFGCTSGRPLTFTMGEVLKNLELRGCTMGSLKEFKQMVQFVQEHKIQPVVHKTLRGFDQVEEGFQIMKAGHQFGKLVVLIDPDTQHKL